MIQELYHKNYMITSLLYELNLKIDGIIQMQAYLRTDLIEKLRSAGWSIQVTGGLRTVRQDLEIQLPRKVYVSSVNIVNRRSGEMREFDLIKEKKIPSPADIKKLFRVGLHL